MWIRYVFLVAATFMGGMAVAGAFVAFITLIGIVPALARQERFFWRRLGMGTTMYLYESLMIAGVFFGTLLSLYEPQLPFGVPGLLIYSFLGGMFTGCLVGALEETLNVFPIISRRTGLRHGMGYLLVAVAVGKCIGSILYFFALKL